MQYIVKDGDTLQKIADYYRVNLDELKEYNNLLDDSIEEGMLIKIPSISPLEYYTVKKGDDLYSIALSRSIPLEILAKINGLDVAENIYPNQVLLVPKSGYQIYLTKKGDSINSIVNKLGLTSNDIINNKDLYLQDEQLLIYIKRQDNKK